jgi:hypothetical protein
VARAPLPHLVALLCGVLAALAVGCGDRSNLIPQSRADALTQQLDDLKAAVDKGDCTGLSGKVKTFHDDATSLSSSVDAGLRKRINEGVAALQDTAVKDCQTNAAAGQTQTTDTTPTDTTTTATTETQTTTTTETQTVPSDTTTTDTTPTTTAPPTTETTPGTATDTGTTPDTGGATGDGVTP